MNTLETITLVYFMGATLGFCAALALDYYSGGGFMKIASMSIFWFIYLLVLFIKICINTVGFIKDMFYEKY